MIKKLIFLLTCIVILSTTLAQAQDLFNGRFRKMSYTHHDNTYTLYDFSRKGTSSTNIKAKYFATNAYQQYLDWKSGKTILLVTAGAFSSGWDSSAIPVGLCVDNGKIINKTAKSEMDGMVIVYNGAAQQGGIVIVDLDKKPVVCEKPYGSGNYVSYYPRDSRTDAINFLDWGESEGLTLFQTQLVYSEKKSETENFGNLYYGDERERRFLAICTKNGVVHHVVVDAPDKQLLIQGTKYVKEVLDYDGFNVLYILNLDTGDKNLLYVYNGNTLENLEPNSNENAKIDKATNLLVYYLN